ncbi:MAG: hypothetical protein ABJO09_19630 [Hyphomicrobiales bacterium]
MVKPPQRPASKTGAQKSSTSGGGQANKSTTSGANTKATPAGTSASRGRGASTKRATTDNVGKTETKLTAKPTTIDLKANEPKKPAASKAAGSSTSTTLKTSQTPTTSSSASSAGAKKTEAVEQPNASGVSTDAEAKPAKASKKPEPSVSKTQASVPNPSTSPTSASITQKGGSTGFLALLLAGIFGGVVTLLGAFALLGSGAMSGLLADKPEEQVNTTEIQVSKLSEDVSGLSSRMKELQSSIAEMSAALNEEQPDLSVPLSKAQNDISAVREELAELAAAAYANSGGDDAALAEIKSQVATDAAESARKLEELSNQMAELVNQQAALEGSVSAGNAGEAPALAALEQRLTGLADAQQAQGALVSPAVREELSALEEELQKLTIQMKVMENLQLLAEEQQAELTELTSAVQTVAQKTDRLEASSEEEPAAESNLLVGSKLDYLQGALESAAATGVPLVGLLTEAKGFLAKHNSEMDLPENLLESATTGIMPIRVIAAQIETAGAEYEASKATPSDTDATDAQDDSLSTDGVMDGLLKGAKSLITIRSTESPAVPASADPIVVLLTEAEKMAINNDLNALSDRLSALAALEAAPASLKDNATAWQNQVAHHQALAGLTDQIKAVQQTIWAQATEGERP